MGWRGEARGSVSLTGLKRKRWRKLRGREGEFVESEMASLTFVDNIHLPDLILLNIVEKR